MKKQEITKEQLKQEESIFEIFSKWKNSTHPAETKKYNDQFCDQIYEWYNDYRSKADMVEELIIVINKISKIINNDKKLNLPGNNAKGLFKYISKSLKNEKINTFRKFNGKKSSYIHLLKLENIEDIPPTKAASKINLQNDYLSKNNVSELKEAVKYILAKKQKRARNCYKALFTIYCIKKDLRDLYPILDQKILDSFHKKREKQKQYEIYQKYHPKVTKKSAEAQASANLRIFLNDIKTCLKERENK